MPATTSEPRELSSPAAVSPAKRRLAAQHVREARDRLTSTSGTRPVFDYELLRQFAQNRLSASLVIVLLVVTIGLLSSLWTGATDVRGVDRRRTAHPPRHHSRMPAISRRDADHAANLRSWRLRFILLDLFFGMAWTFILIHPIGVDEQSGTFMLFVMLLVVAISSMLASSLPVAVFALTLPVTMAIALDFALQGHAARLHPRRHGAGRRRLFLAARLPALFDDAGDARGARREGRAHRRARAGEVDLRRGAPPRRGGQHRQVALSRADEPRAAHAAQRHPRLLRGDEGRDVRRARGAGLQGICRRHP